MRLLKSSSLRTAFIVVVSYSLALSLSFSLRLASVSANPVKPSSVAAPPPQVLSHSLATVKMMYLKAVAFFQGGINLSTMRSSTPQQPSYSSTGTLPSAGYDDPKPTNTSNYDSYLTRLAARENAVGSGQPMQLFDPTAGAAVVGGVSYNLDSKNYSFSLPVMSLAGRAGLNVGLGLSYNSKLWTKDSTTSTMIFNGDRGFPAPGWHTGFGAILIKHTSVGPYINSTTGKSSIIFIAPDGTRRDMGYNSASGRFETYDSTYLKFDAVAQILYSPDGTKMKFGVYSYDTNVHDYLALPIEIKDRNGNFITIAYRDLTTSVGVKKVIDYVTDTAGRRIDFNYQSNRLTSISQTRGGTTFYFVRLDYQPVTIQTSFLAPYVTATDPSNINGTVVYFPSRVTYPTGVNFRFSYTNYGQIKQIEKAVPGITGQGLQRVIAKTTFNVVECLDPNAPPNSPNYCTPQADVPYFNVRTEWAENWQGGQTQYYQYNLNADSGFGIYYVITDPTGRQFKMQNLNQTMYTEIWAQNAGNHTKKDTAIFIHDNLSYYSNLRPQETRATAQTGTSYVTKTTQVSYTQLNGMWVPNQQDEFAAGVQYRRTLTTYTSYPSQNILALPLEVSVYSGAGTTLLTKATNAYDQTSSFTDSNGQTAEYFIDATADGAIQHDDTNYGGSFTTRGNLTSVTQHSVVNGSVNGSRILKRISYDTNGNVRAETDPAGNRKQIVYTDNYLDKPGGVGNTCVYPHTTADPTGFRSGAQWLYYTGQSKKTFNLLPGGGTEEQVVTTIYDFADRPSQTTRPDGGWVKTDYWDNWLAVASSQQVDAGKVRFKFEQMDGVGRAYKKASDHPDGASGKFAGQISVFDKVGQVQDSSNVLAIDGSWIPSGEDVGKSFLWTHLTRDELARLKLVTLPDNNSRELDYEGCGCAGSNATRLTDELGHATVTKNDARGRLIEAIEENPNNLFVPYSKAEYVYDELDRLLTINHSGEPLTYQGPRPVQTRTFSYDGYGRMTSETTPEGGTVTYTYTANDQVWQVTNQRPVTTIHTYNSRGLLTNVSYSDSTPAVTYSYDAYGARTTVTDGEGATNYSYNSYRQLQSETRTFAGLTNNTYTLNYTYNQGDQVKSVNYQVIQSSGLTNNPGESLQIATMPQSEQIQRPVSQVSTKRTTSKRRTQAMTTNRWITGTVRHAATNLGIGGATVTANRLDDPALGPNPSVQTSSNSQSLGYYQIEDLPDGATYRLTVSKNGYVFSPSEVTFEMTEDKQQDFTGLEYPPTGTLSASPNPIQVCDGSGQGTPTLTWSATGVTAVQIRRGSPNGPLVANGGTSGSVLASQTTHGTVFYLQNVTGGLPLTSANTLTTVTVNLTTQGCPTFGNFDKTINYDYNAVGALSAIGTNLIGGNTANNVLNTITFRASGALRQLNYGNGRRLTMGYDDNRNQPTSMVVDRTNNSADKVVDYAYQYYDANGKNNNRIRQITDNIDTAYSTTYTYDNYNRLTNATANAFSRNYQHDPFGNITNFSGLTLNYQTNFSGAPATNRIDTDSQNFSYTYDAAGNMTVGAGQSYSYDGANRLKTASTGTSSYGYDGDGKRVKKTENGATTYYVYSTMSGQAMMEVTAVSIQRAYIYDGKKLVAMQAADGQFYWNHRNHLGNSRAMTDVSGNLTYKGQFDPYGATLTEWANSGNTNLNSKKFTGYERDSATGLDYAEARMYSSGRGRLLTPDPMGLKAVNQKRPESLNRYAYVGNDPVNFVDPAGTFAYDPRCLNLIWNGLTVGNTCSGIFGSFWDMFQTIMPEPEPVPEPYEPEPAPVTTCKIELWSRPLDYILGDYNPINWAHHMFITTQQVSSDANLNQAIATVFQGLHEGDLILAGQDSFAPPNKDYMTSRSNNAIHVALFLPGKCDEINANFKETIDKINDKKLKYEVGVPNLRLDVNNSNAVAYTLLERWNPNYRQILGALYFANSGTPPSAYLPGWGHRMPL